MKLLLTNDDSIESVFLHELVKALRTAGHELYVVAPKTEQSWIGAAKSRHRPVRSTPADRGLGCPTWIVDGTPCRRVRVGISPGRPPVAIPTSGSSAGRGGGRGWR